MDEKYLAVYIEYGPYRDDESLGYTLFNNLTEAKRFVKKSRLTAKLFDNTLEEINIYAR